MKIRIISWILFCSSILKKLYQDYMEITMKNKPYEKNAFTNTHHRI